MGLHCPCTASTTAVHLLWHSQCTLADSPKASAASGAPPHAKKEGLASFNRRRHVTCLVEKAGFDLEDTRRGALTTPPLAQYPSHADWDIYCSTPHHQGRLPWRKNFPTRTPHCIPQTKPNSSALAVASRAARGGNRFAPGFRVAVRTRRTKRFCKKWIL